MIKLNSLQIKVLSELLENVIDNTQTSFKKGKFNSICTMEFDEYDLRALGHIKNKLQSDPAKLDLNEFHKVVFFYGDNGIIISITAYFDDGTLAYNYFNIKGIVKDESGISQKIVDMILRKNSRFKAVVFTDDYQIFESKT